MKLEGFKNDISFRGYQAKGDEKRQGEGRGPKIGKMGQRRLWMAPKEFTRYIVITRLHHLVYKPNV